MKTYFSVNIGSKVFALVALLLFITASNSLAGTKTAMGSGNWNSITWSPSGSPTSNDDVIIKQGYNVTVNGTYACKSIQLGSSASTAGNGTLTFNAGSQLTVSGIVTLGMSPSYTGTINMTSGGTLICNSFAVAGAGTNTFTKGTGTVQLTANNTLPTSAFTAFNNLVISNGAITTVGGTYTCNSLQLGSSTVPAGNGTLSFNAGSQITVAGAVTLGMSTYGGTLSMASGGTLISNSLAVAGTGTNTFTPGSGTIQLAANNTLPTSVFTAFNNLVINNASTTTIGGTYTCKSLQLGSSAAPAGNGTLLFNAGSQITVAGAVTLGMGTYGGTLTMTSGGTLACNSLAVAGSGTNTFTKGTGTVQLTANNTLPTSVFNAFNNLVISNGATTTMNSTYTANSIQLGSTNAPAGNGTLAFASGSQLTIAGTLTSGMGTYAGVVDMTSGGTLISNAFAASGSGASSFIGGTGTVRLPANNTLPATGFSSFNNLVICGGSTTTLTGSYSCNSLQLGSSVAPTGNGTLLFNAGSQITVNGVVTLGASTYKGVIDMTSGGTLTCNSIVLAGSGANSFIPGAGTLQMAGNNTLPSTVFTTFNNLSCSGGTTIANSGFTAASISLTGTANLTLSGAYDYTVTGNLTSTAGTTLTQNTDWSTGTRRLNIGGNFLLSGAYTYSGVSPLVRLYGTGSKSFKGLGLCFVLLESGDYTCAGNVSFTNQFWAMYNTTGTLHTGANSITGTTMTGNLFICKGTVTVDNGGSINAFTIFNGTIPSQSYGGNGTLIINSGGSVTSTLFYNGSYNGIASNVTINGTLNVINQTVGGTPQTGQIINGKWGSSTPCVININDGGLLNSTNEIINGFNSSPGTINVSNLGTITAGGMCNGKYPNGSGSSAGILNCTGNATINIHDTPTQWYCWSDFGTFNCGTSTVTFNGTGNGYILENTGSKFYNLVINKPSGNNMLALTPVHVLVDFTLSSGDFGYSGVQSMNVGRNWTQTGTSNYNHSNTPVTFDGTNSTITTTSTGTIAFYDVIIADVAIQASNVDINGSLTINNGKSHSTSASNYALSIGGSLTNNGTFTSGNSTVTFDDVIDGNITGSNACSFYNMVINKSASTNTLTNGATSKVFTIGNDLTITQGKLILCAVDGDYNIARNVYVASNGTLTHSVAWDTYSKKINVTGSFEVDGLLNPTLRSYISLSGAGSKNVRTGTNTSSSFSRVTFSNGDYTATGTVRSNQECYAMNGTSGSFHTNGNLASFASTYVNIGPLYIDGVGTTLTTDSIELMNNGNVYHSAGVANYGTLKINSGSTYECSNSPSVYISNTMNNNGTLTWASSTFTFNGNNNQTIRGSAPSTFYNLTLNNTGILGIANKISLIQPIAVTGKFDPNQGILITDNTNILTMIAGSTTNTTAGTETSFVDGPMIKIGSTAFTYPTGDINGNNYVWAPIGMSSPASASDSYTAQYFFSSPEPVAGNNWISSMMCDPSALDHVSGIEYWDLHQNIGSNYPDVTLYWKSGTRSDIQNISDIVVSHWESCASNGGANKWASKDGNVVNGSTPSSGSVTSSVAFSSYSPITFGTKNKTNPLPIELISFNANCSNNNIVIDWTTASETNNNYFILEGSTDAKTWRHVKTIEGGHNSSTMRNYTVVDENANSAISYYKLTQVDFDGNTKTFDPISVICPSIENENPSVSFYPNPFISNITVDISNLAFEKGTIQIFDMVGKLVIEKLIGNKDFDASKLNINLQSLPSGLYSVNFTTNNFTTSSKIIKDF